MQQASKLKESIMKAKQRGMVPSKTHVDKYKEFSSTIDEAKEYEDELEILQEELDSNYDEINLMQDSILHAKIINKDGWHTLNKIYFKILRPVKKIIEYVPTITDRASEITLVETTSDKFEVKFALKG